VLEGFKNNPYIKEYKGKWQNLENNKKLGVGVLLGCLVAALILLGSWGLQKDYIPLYTGLEVEEAGEIVNRLKERNVSYQLTDGGTSILVPEEEVYDLRLDIAGEGMLHGSGTGFELFDQTRLGATDFERRLNYQRALQEELRRTITQMQEVEQARVHLVMPEPTVFVDEAEDASASVLLRLEPLSSLDKNQVRAIVNLVSGSVENLTPEHVTVVDSHGLVLSDELGSKDPAFEGAELTLKQLEVRRNFETELESRLQKSLEKVYGPGRVVAMVTAEMDFDAQESTTITYGEEALPRTHTIVEESYTGEGAPPPGEAGADSNIPGYFAYGAGGDMEYERREEARDYEINERVQREVKAPGKVEKISTAVMVDNNREGFAQMAEGGQLEEDIAGLVSSAIGLDDERGDTVNVQFMDFDTEMEDRAADMIAQMDEQAAQQAMLRNYALAGGLLGLILLAAGVLIFSRKKKGAAEDEMEEESMGVDELIADAEEVKPENQVKESHKQVKEMADANPEEVVQLLKTWLVEE